MTVVLNNMMKVFVEMDDDIPAGEVSFLIFFKCKKNNKYYSSFLKFRIIIIDVFESIHVLFI